MRTHEYIIACVSLFYYRASLAFINGDRKSRGNRCRVEEASTVKDSCGNFNWNNQWYPVGVIDQLDKERPHPIIVRGRELVLWFDESMTEWRVFEDRCPHRAAPLSEGRVEASGHLFCGISWVRPSLFCARHSPFLGLMPKGCNQCINIF